MKLHYQTIKPRLTQLEFRIESYGDFIETVMSQTFTSLMIDGARPAGLALVS